MSRSQRQRPNLQRATCAALIAASFAVGPVEAESVSSIERYCQTSWRHAGIPQDDWEDCTQETMAELLSRVPRNQMTRAIEHARSWERRELVRAIWCVTQRWRRGSQRQAVNLDTVASPASVDGNAEDQLAMAELISDSLDKLSANQRRILELWSEGHSVAEISTQLQMPPARVSDQKYKAIRVLREKLQPCLFG